MFSAKAALLSVIIPVYNVEPYLEECLNSVINQTYKNLEIICINDGSTDNSLKILEKFAKKDMRIKVIDQKNKGVSAARNAGLNIATGEYVTFVDPDDYLELRAYENALRVMLLDKGIDLVEFRIDTFTDDNDSINKDRAAKISEECKKMMRRKDCMGSACNKIFKFSIIRDLNLIFPSYLAVAEDTYFSYAYYTRVHNKRFIDLPFYRYRVRSGSATGTEARTKFKRQMCVYFCFDSLIEFAKVRNILNSTKTFIFRHYSSSICKFCDDNHRLKIAVQHCDCKILNSDCPHDLKLKYIEKRGAIIYAVEHPFEYECYKIFSKLCNFFDIIK